MTTKQCKKCGESKDLSLFGRQQAAKDGLKNECKACVKLSNQKRYEKNKEKHKESVKNWQAENHDKVLEYKKNYNRRVRSSVITDDADQKALREEG